MTTNLGVSHRGLNDKSLQWKPRHARRKDPARFADMGLDNIIVAREQRQRLSSARTQFRAILHKRRSVNSLEEARDLRRKGLTKKFSNTVVETNEERIIRLMEAWGLV